MDVAASEFWVPEKKKYDLNFKGKDNDGSQQITGEELTNLYIEFIQKYPMKSIEDPFDQDDWDAYKNMTDKVGQKCQIVGDDLLVTNPVRVK